MTTPPAPRPRSRFEKLVILFVTGMGIGFGTCGLAAFTRADQNSIGIYVARAGSDLFFLSLAGLVLTVLAFIVQQLWELFRK